MGLASAMTPEGFASVCLAAWHRNAIAEKRSRTYEERQKLADIVMNIRKKDVAIRKRTCASWVKSQEHSAHSKTFMLFRAWRNAVAVARHTTWNHTVAVQFSVQSSTYVE